MQHLILILLAFLALVCATATPTRATAPSLVRRVHRNNTGTLADIFSAPNEDADIAEEPDANDHTLGVDHHSNATSAVDYDSYDSDFDHTWVPELIVSTSQWKHYCSQGRILCWHGVPTNFLRDALSMTFYLAAAMLGPLLLGLTVWKGCMKWIWSYRRHREQRRVRKRFLDFDVRQRRIRRMKVGMSSRPAGARPMPGQQQQQQQHGHAGPSTAALTARPRTMIGSTGRGNGRPLTMINTDLGSVGNGDLPRCSVLLSPRSSAQGAFGFGAGVSRFNLIGPRAMPIGISSGNSSPMTDPLLSPPLPINLQPGQVLSPAMSDTLYIPSPSRSSPLPGHSPVETNSPIGLWPSEGFRTKQRQQQQIHMDDSPRPFSVSTADSSTEEGGSSGSSPSDPRESMVSWTSGASAASNRTLLTAEQKRASLRTSWMAPSHREAATTRNTDTRKKHNRMASVVSSGLDSSADAQGDSQPTAYLHVPASNPSAPRSILRPSVLIPRPPKLRVSFFAGSGGDAAPTTAGTHHPNASSEALVGGMTPPNETADCSLDMGDLSLSSSIGFNFPVQGNKDETLSFALGVQDPNHDAGALTPTLEKPTIADSVNSSPPTSPPQRHPSRRRTLTDDIAELDPTVLHAFTARMKFRASAFDGAAWGWEWHRNEKSHAKQQVEKAVAAAAVAASAGNGINHKSAVAGRYRGRTPSSASSNNDVVGYPDSLSRRSVFGRVVSPSSWTQIQHQRGHWAWDKDGSAMGVGISPADFDVDEKIPKELRSKLYEMWGFSETAPYFR